MMFPGSKGRRIFMSIIDKVLGRPEFETDPPVLIDVGASGALHSAWKDLSKYAVCIAFDADDREMRAARRSSKVYRALYIYNRALTAGAEGVADFYLTKEPACRACLLRVPTNWPPGSSPAVSLSSRKLPWRLSISGRCCRKWVLKASIGSSWTRRARTCGCFKVSGRRGMRRVLVAEFEPGILDSYQGEDKLWQLMSSMEGGNFWMTDIQVHGSRRIRKNLLGDFARAERDYLIHLLKPAPGWAEVAYMNTFVGENFRLRDYLLGWVCATVQGQHGFALELASVAKQRFGDPLCEELKDIPSLPSGGAT